MSNKLSYTNKDIKALREELIEYAKTLTTDWTDFNESDLGMVFIELMTGIADMLNFYLDKQALEVFLSTVKQRKNGKGILSLLGYKFKMVTACTAIINCEVLIGEYEEFTIPKFSKVPAMSDYSNSSTIMYVTAYDYTVTKDNPKFSLPIIQGEPITVEVATGDIPDNYRIYLQDTSIAEGSISLELDGIPWEEVEDVFLDDVDGPKFSVYETKDDVTYIMLHPSYQNFIPVDTSLKFVITYLNTLGPEGKISAESIFQFGDLQTLPNGYKLNEIISVINPERSSGGANRESLALAKKRAVNNLYTMKTAVVLTDYSDLAETVPGILKAKAIDWSVEDSKYISVPYKVDVYCIPEEGTYCSEYQLQLVKEFLNERKTCTITLNCYNAEYVDIDIDCDIYTTAPESKWSEIISSAEEELIEFFKLPEQSINSDKFSRIDFGVGIMYSNLSSTIERSSSYISYIDLKVPNTSITIDAYQFPRLNKVNLTVKKRGR